MRASATRQVPSSVNFVAKGCPIYAAAEEVPGATAVVARHVSNACLWDRVRVQGGAYTHRM